MCDVHTSGGGEVVEVYGGREVVEVYGTPIRHYEEGVAWEQLRQILMMCSLNRLVSRAVL